MRLHPLSVPYRIVRALALSLYVVVPVALAFVSGAGTLFAASDAVVERAAAYGLVGVVAAGAAVVVALGAIVAWQVVYYRRFEYALADEAVEVRSGVLWRREREIPYGRIQSVSVSSNVAQRALGIAEVELQTAGGGLAEARVRCVDRERARWLRSEISRRKGDAEAPSDDEAEALFELRGRELALLGFARFEDNAFVLLLSAFPFYIAGFSRLVAGSVESVGVLASLFAIGLTLLTGAISTAYAVLGFYGFRLVRDEDELRYERGLLRRYTGTIPLEKVQAVTVAENPLARALGYASLTVETAGYSWQDDGTATVAVPLAKRERVVAFAREVEPVEVPDLERPPRRARERYAVRYLLVVAVLTALSYGVARLESLSIRWWLPAVLAVLVPVAAHLKWRNLGYALTGDHVVTRKGFWNRTTTVVPYHRVQTVIDGRTVFQRRRRLATVTVDTAGAFSLVSNDSQAVDVDREVAAALRETTARRLQAAVAERRPEPTGPASEPAVADGGD